MKPNSAKIMALVKPVEVFTVVNAFVFKHVRKMTEAAAGNGVLMQRPLIIRMLRASL